MAAASSSSIAALRCRRVLLNATAEKDSKFKPLGKSQRMRSASASLQTKSGNSSNAMTTMTSRVSIYSAPADDPFHHKHRASMTTTEKEETCNDGKEPVCANKLDEWMRDSVVEIVRNIGNAPFLVHLYSDGEEGSPALSYSSRTRLEREPAVPENWPRICRKWKENSASKPDGVILVEQLKGGEDEDGDGDGAECCSQCSKSWGIVIQGRGLDRAACYILKTSRVCSSAGFCTHFCLVRAKCFGEAAELQLRDSWLLQQWQ